jgi:hypothetical protein
VENYYGQMDELARVYDLDPKLWNQKLNHDKQ